MECQHNKVYENIILYSYPPQQRWICSICGEKGTDVQSLSNEITYEDLIKHFEGDD